MNQDTSREQLENDSNIINLSKNIHQGHMLEENTGLHNTRPLQQQDPDTVNITTNEYNYEQIPQTSNQTEHKDRLSRTFQSQHDLDRNNAMKNFERTSLDNTNNKSQQDNRQDYPNDHDWHINIHSVTSYQQAATTERNQRDNPTQIQQLTNDNKNLQEETS
jgi:hypothetical protein